MSRGHGYVQRFILAELDAASVEWLPGRALAARFPAAGPPGRQRRSVWRALQLLVAAGLVEIRPEPMLAGHSAYAVRVAPGSARDAAARRARALAAEALRLRIRERNRIAWPESSVV
jgi:hypothetical protein